MASGAIPEHADNIAGLDASTRDTQSVTPEGELVQEPIDGVRVRPATTHLDERGSVCEIYSPAWDFTEEALVWVYQTTIRPAQIKGWVLHLEQDDRLFFSSGDVKVVLYDARPDSPTFGHLNIHTFGEAHRALVRIPAGVYHALQNVGQADAVFINLPTRPYRHEDPDKYRLPLDTPEIPYRF
ncbi:MAG TPA: dTDP-4-dehydrorhamnose 3,5-epimerase family protein [Gaiellaceae bacterium]|nr:dTDP-4-dehydrorhamnose 3,5-epimerase family protein [Gaiellaceae bacterium]